MYLCVFVRGSLISGEEVRYKRRSARAEISTSGEDHGMGDSAREIAQGWTG